MISQLPLALAWPDVATFDNFYAAGNLQVLTCLRDMVQGRGEKQICLQGFDRVGLSHLLYAACHQMQQLSGRAAYLSFKHSGLSSQLLEGMAHFSLVCWDDIEMVAGNREWEEALFHCYNQIQATGTALLLATHLPLGQIGWGLPDLKSRFMASTLFTVQSLTDPQKIQALQSRAKRRGLELSEEVGRYLLNHYPRYTQDLFIFL
jgi:DnaA family protein